MSAWNAMNGTGDANVTKNAEVADRAFMMLICARLFVLKCIMKNLSTGTDPMVARRRWVLVQALPPFLRCSGDIFAIVVDSLRAADTAVMRTLANTMLVEIWSMAGTAIFPINSKPLFAVVDEVQVAAEYLKGSFRSSTPEIDLRPVLHAFRGFLWNLTFLEGVIFAGTGLSMKMRRTLGPGGAQRMKYRPIPFVLVEVGRFTKDGTAHENYIRKYLHLSRSSNSDQRLVERILYWFSGRWVQPLNVVRHITDVYPLKLPIYSEPD